MPIARFEMPDGRIARFEVPDGVSPEQAQQMISAQMAQQEQKPAPLGKQMNKELAAIPRGVGMGARTVLEGLGAVPQFLLGQPMEALGLKGAGTNVGQSLSDMMDLPKPESTAEKVASETGKLLLPTGAVIRGAGMASKALSGGAQNVANLLAANPVMQGISATGAGVAGNYVKETGGNEGSQFVASLAGGVGAPAAAALARDVPKNLLGASRALLEKVAPGATQRPDYNIDIVINSALRPSGVTLADLPNAVAAQLRNDVAKSGDLSKLSPDAVRRLADYRRVGAAPTVGSLTLDPVKITREKNLAKLGANTSDPSLQSLAQRENANNAQLISKLNEQGVTGQDSYAAGQTVMGRLLSSDQRAKGKIDALYQQARNTDGRSAMLDPSAFTGRANELLDSAMLGGKLPADVRNNLNRIAQGEMPLTVDVAEQFKTSIGQLQRSSADPAERLALSQVRQALDDTPLVDGQGQQAIDAFNKARKANRTWMQIVEKSPALQAVRDGIEPDKFVQKFIIGSGDTASVMSVDQLGKLTKGNQEASAAIRNQITTFLKDKALSGASDEVGKFSQSGFNNALKSIGDRKLALFFRPEEIETIKALGRVSSYEQVQPKGSAVNNSNTAAMGIGTMLDKLGNMPLISKIPLGNQIIGEPARNISAGISARQALDIPAGLLMPSVNKSGALKSGARAFALPGLLGIQE